VKKPIDFFFLFWKGKGGLVGYKLFHCTVMLVTIALINVLS
jgi:hypothetical protein